LKSLPLLFGLLFSLMVNGQVLPDLPNIGVLNSEIDMPDTAGYVVKTVGPSAYNDYHLLQHAIDSAQYGTVLVLEAGATFEHYKDDPNSWAWNDWNQGYMLRYKPNTNGKWIIITGSQTNLISPPCTRVYPDSATGNTSYPTQRQAMPKIITRQSSAAIYTADSANHYRIIGVEIGPASDTTYLYCYGLVEISSGDQTPDDSLSASIPSHIIFDRCYIHGNDTSYIVRGVHLDGSYAAVINSEIADISGTWQDAQAIATWNSPGPLAVLNNYLEATTENIIIGGAAPVVYGTVPSDIVVKWNYFTKRTSWMDYPASLRSVKDLFETKCVRRLLLEGNVFENVWPSAWAVSTALMIRSLTGDPTGGQSDDSTQANNITIRNNVIRNAGTAITVDGWFAAGGHVYPTWPLPAQTYPNQMNKLLISNNLIYNLGPQWLRPDASALASFLVMGNPTSNVTVDHNTVFNKDWGGIVYFEEPLHTDFYFKNNIVFLDTANNNEGAWYEQMGFEGTGVSGASGYTYQITTIPEDTVTPLTIYAGPTSTVNGRFQNNVLINRLGWDVNDFSNSHSIHYPAGSFFPSTLNAVGFTDTANSSGYSNFALINTSPFKNAATDGQDVGVGFTQFNAALVTNSSYCNTVPTGIEKRTEQVDIIRIYPNPATGSCVIESGSAAKRLLQVYDISGKLVFTQLLQSVFTTIDTGNFPQGIYDLRIAGAEGVSNNRLVVIKF